MKELSEEEKIRKGEDALGRAYMLLVKWGLEAQAEQAAKEKVDGDAGQDAADAADQPAAGAEVDGVVADGVSAD